mmetsp:Transcript_17332/g.38340  ORF Transcript_17332/g.38340 Transcript_17332/m.38340 type:complete len:201 (-) Transcript_17332:357-959(-)
MVIIINRQQANSPLGRSPPSHTLTTATTATPSRTLNSPPRQNAGRFVGILPNDRARFENLHPVRGHLGRLALTALTGSGTAPPATTTVATARRRTADELDLIPNAQYIPRRRPPTTVFAKARGVKKKFPRPIGALDEAVAILGEEGCYSAVFDRFVDVAVAGGGGRGGLTTAATAAAVAVAASRSAGTTAAVTGAVAGAG